MSDISNEWKELRPKIGNFICRIDEKLNEQPVNFQAKIDEAYNKGIQDLYDALKIFNEMPNSIIIDKFGSTFLTKIVQYISPQDLIYKLNQWKAEKDKEEQELHVGDEILVIDSNPKLNGRTFVVYEIDDSSYYVIEPLTFYKDGFFKNAYIKNQIKKTGKHYDSIPLSKEID